MAATSEPSIGNTASLPVVDLRLVSQPELFTLSFSHDTGRNRRIDDDSVIPRIDRSVFNESAGSRKQTFSRLNFRNNNNNNPNYSVPVAPVVPASESSSSHITVDEENSQIIDLLQQLFGVEALRGANDDRLVPFQGEFKQPAIEFTPQGFQSVAIGGVDGSQRKRKRGRPRRDETSLVVVGDGDVEMVEAVNEQKVGTANKKKDFVLEDAGDPFVEELIVRTQGMNTEAQLSEFLEGLNGVWASDRKKRRIVDANVICDLLPTGWKLILILQRRGARNSVVCRRYVSPDGRQFESYKDVSSYLDGSQQFSNNINMASENQNVGHVPIGGIKIDDNASSRHEKQATISSSIETGKRNTSDGCLNGDRAMDFELGDTTSGAFGVSDHPADDKLQQKANKNDVNSYQGCSLSEDRVYNQSAGHIPTGGMKIDANASSHKKKQATMSSSIGTAKLNSSNRKPDRILVLGLKAIDVACNHRISDFRAPISNSSCSINRFSDERCLKGGVSIIDGQDKSTGCYETAPNGNERVPVGGHVLGFSTTLVESHIQKIGSENSMLVPNSEGKNGGKLVKEDDSQQIIDGQDKNTGCYETAPNGNERVPVGGHGLGFSTTLIENQLQNIGSENSMLVPNSEGKNDGKLIKEDGSQQIIDGQDKSTGCYETAPNGNERVPVGGHGLGFSTTLIENHLPNIGSENSMLFSNSEGKNDGKLIKEDGSQQIIDGQDKSTVCYETAPNGNERVPVGGHRLGFSATLIENQLQNIDSENSMLAPNSEGKNAGKLVKEDDSQQIISSTYLSEIQDISTKGKLQFGSEGSLVPSQNGLNHTSTDNMNNGQTSMLNDSAEGNFFYNDIPSSSIDERTWDPNGYINDISFGAWPQDTSESGGVDFTPILYVADNVGHNHIPPTSCLQKSSMNDQILTMDNLLHRSSESSLFTVTGDHHPSAFHDNMNNISAGTFGALKHVDDGCMKPQSGIVSCSDVVAIDAYASPRPQSVPSDGSLLNQFDKQNDDGVNNGYKSFLSEMAKNEVEIFPTDLMGMPKFQ
ncbi:methyl-CpG-binding domain-containing protein [Trifolium repens]|nr:methyl-CpG-binding domain-containing protein [Trifolium repens]